LKRKIRNWNENKFQYYKYKVRLRKTFIDDKLSYIIECSNLHEINPKLLYGVLLIEYVNRGNWRTRTIESVLVKYFIHTAVKLDMSIGIGQIRISTAKQFLTDVDSPNMGRKLLEDKFSIEVCARILSHYIHITRHAENPLLDIVKFYTTGKNLSESNASIELYYSLLKWILEGTILKGVYGYELQL